jgi:uncharacterized membrane protein
MDFSFYGFYLAPAVLGGAIGFWIYLPTQRQLTAIEKKGEFVGTRRYNLLVIFGAVIVGAAFILFAIHIPAMLHPSLSFLGINLLSSYSSYVFLLRRWERKHKKEILMDGGWLQGRIYASEKTPPPPPQLLPPPPPPDL